MGNQLLVRAYNVGVGDCIYVRIPNGKDDFHILIDCGKKGSTTLLDEAIQHMEVNLLPPGDRPGKKRLDLIVVTHRHEDHIKGFNPDLFKNIEIKNIWLSAVMDENHPQAEKTHKLHAFATTAMRDIEARGLALSPDLQMLASLYSINNTGAMKALKTGLPQQNGIQAKYVYAGQTSKTLGVPLKEALIHVIGPEKNIDRFYLGKETDESLLGLMKAQEAFADQSTPVAKAMPKNISAGDFRLLQTRILSNALAFAEKDSGIQNNVSVVLLIEWRKRRLLFVGDAEWHGEYKDGKHNGSWNVMWNHRKNHLNKPVDFLKIGHHGSINASPHRADKDATYEVNQILNAILPLPKKGKTSAAQAVVSTERSYYKPIPQSDMLVALGKRVSNTRRYQRELGKMAGFNPLKDISHFEEREEKWLDEPQPLRTDLEKKLTGQDFIDTLIDPGDN